MWIYGDNPADPTPFNRPADFHYGYTGLSETFTLTGDAQSWSIHFVDGSSTPPLQYWTPSSTTPTLAGQIQFSDNSQEQNLFAEVDWVDYSTTYASGRWRYPVGWQSCADNTGCKPPVVACNDGVTECSLYNSWDDVPNNIEQNVLTHPTFEIKKSWVVEEISTDHYNAGAGKDPLSVAGTISIYKMVPGHENDPNNTSDVLIGTYNATSNDGGLTWTVAPNITLLPGVYRIQDSDLTSWSSAKTQHAYDPVTCPACGPQAQVYVGLAKVKVSSLLPTNMTLTSSANPAPFGQPVTFTSQVKPTTPQPIPPIGCVVFTINGSSFGCVPLNNGSAAVTVSTMGVGVQVVQATYGGDANYATNSASLNQTVTQAPSSVTLTTSGSPSVYGQSVILLANITVANSVSATGAVTFFDGGNFLCMLPVLGNQASCPTKSLVAGTHMLTAVYSGDGNVVGSTSAPVAQMVNRSTTLTTIASSLNPSYPNQQVTFAATVTPQYVGAVTGSVVFKQGAVNVATSPVVNGVATYSTTYTTTGTRSITAVYSGDGNNTGSTSVPVKQVVNGLPAVTTTALSTSGTPSFINQPVAFTATVTSTYGPIPDGELVTFYDGAAVLATVPLAGGTAALTTSSLAKGTHTIKASYGGDATFKASYKTVSQVVSLYSSSVVVSSNLDPTIFGQAVSFTAVVTSQGPSVPSGTVTFKNGTVSLGSVALNANGVATLTKSTIGAGSNNITAWYNGDAQTNKSTSNTLVQLISPAATFTGLVSSIDPALAGQPVTFTARVTSPTTVPTGKVTFYDGTTVLAEVTLGGGKAIYTTYSLIVGSHYISAVYGGTPNIIGSNSATILQTVQ